MPRVWSPIRTHRRKGGFSTVEVLLAASIFGFLATALIGAIVYGREATAHAGDRARAVILASEGVEAARNIRDAGFANLVDGTYGIAKSGGQWVLSGSSDSSDIYTRQVAISTVDSSRKTITSTVSWNNGTVGRQSQVATRLANWRASITPPTSWTNATQSGTLNLGTTTDARRVATQGNYAYVAMAGGTPNFYVVNISNVAAPTQIASLTLATSPLNVTVSGNYAYIVTSGNLAEMQIVNISNPASPTLVGTFDSVGNADAYGIRVSGNYAYISRLTNGGSNEVQIINISNPAAPTLTGAYSLAQNMRDICVLGNYAYVATDSDTQELLVLNITNPATPTLTTSLDLSGTTNPTALRCYNNLVFVGHGAVLRAVNVTNPAAPTVVGSLTATGSGVINDISADETNNYLFLATAYASGEFQVVNASNPASMSVIKTVDVTTTPATLNGVAFSTMLDVVVGASVSDTQEFVIFKKN